jgi:hypothetical protein
VTDPGYPGSATVPRCERCCRVHERTFIWSWVAGGLGWLVGLVAVTLSLVTTGRAVWQAIAPGAFVGLLPMAMFFLLTRTVLGRVQRPTKPESFANEYPAVRAKRRRGWSV